MGSAMTHDQHSDNDPRLLTRLAESLEATDPVPSEAALTARFAFAWRALVDAQFTPSVISCVIPSAIPSGRIRLHCVLPAGQSVMTRRLACRRVEPQAGGESAVWTGTRDSGLESFLRALDTALPRAHSKWTALV